MGSGGFWWVLVDSDGFLVGFGGFWWVLVRSGGFWSLLELECKFHWFAFYTEFFCFSVGFIVFIVFHCCQFIVSFGSYSLTGDP